MKTEPKPKKTDMPTYQQTVQKARLNQTPLIFYHSSPFKINANPSSTPTYKPQQNIEATKAPPITFC